ncbi:hypothetical protein JCM11251_003447 [Rhodosporidiobolus azoricus]
MKKRCSCALLPVRNDRDLTPDQHNSLVTGTAAPALQAEYPNPQVPNAILQPFDNFAGLLTLQPEDMDNWLRFYGQDVGGQVSQKVAVLESVLTGRS